MALSFSSQHSSTVRPSRTAGKSSVSGAQPLTSKPWPLNQVRCSYIRASSAFLSATPPRCDVCSSRSAAVSSARSARSVTNSAACSRTSGNRTAADSRLNSSDTCRRSRRDGERRTVRLYVDDDRVPVPDLTGEQRAGELVADRGLHQAAQWAGPVDRVETVEGQPLPRALGHL